ncbi:hypothetical protein [Bradyrhizobium sp. HKCCYLRH3083]|uniref:hypothetical protein n=1 Tax=unclassified Bradyrhizobium TaxID=2631580 RepID=UPI003EB6C515
MKFPTGWWIQGVAIMAAVALLGSSASAGCSFEDVANAFCGTLKATSDCKSVCEDDASCAAAVALEIALAGVALEGSDTGKGQGLVDQFCAEAKVKGKDIVGALNTIFGNAIAKEVLGDLSTELAAVGSAAKVVQCACETEQSTNSIGADIGACIQDALCGGLGIGCNCSRPPPQMAYCGSVDVKHCQTEGHFDQMKDPACVPYSSIANCNDKWQKCGYGDNIPTVERIESAEGTLAVQLPPTQEDTGCDPVISCFCPKPMVPAWHEISNPNSDVHRWLFACDCPYEANNPDHQTHPGPILPSGLSQCLCDNTGKPANLGFAPFGMCPPPACPAGQTRMGLTGACVTPCSDPTQGMAFDGSCCNPAQMTSCGQCCPVGTIPDPNSGTCVPKQAVK